VFKRIETRIVFLESFSTAEWHAKNRLEEAGENTAVCYDNDGLVRMTIRDCRKYSRASVEALLRGFTSRDDIVKTCAVVSFLHLSELLTDFTPGQSLKESHMPFAPTRV